jgi:hypothetical protein
MYNLTYRAFHNHRDQKFYRHGKQVPTPKARPVEDKAAEEARKKRAKQQEALKGQLSLFVLD